MESKRKAEQDADDGGAEDGSAGFSDDGVDDDRQQHKPGAAMSRPADTPATKPDGAHQHGDVGATDGDEVHAAASGEYVIEHSIELRLPSEDHGLQEADFVGSRSHVVGEKGCARRSHPIYCSRPPRSRLKTESTDAARILGDKPGIDSLPSKILSPVQASGIEAAQRREGKELAPGFDMFADG